MLVRAERRRRVGLFLTAWDLLKIPLLAAWVALAIYCGLFTWHFELTSAPVLNRERGWLGPRIRQDRHTIDIGKTGYYASKDYRLYDSYRPLCRAWIWLNGLSYGVFGS
jgi:hypothetical protein